MTTYSFKEWPGALQRRWLLSGAAGAGFLLVGLVMYFVLSDRTLFMLSALLAGAVALRCLAFYRTARAGAYETIEGVCIGIGRAGLGKQRTVRLLQYDGNECAITLDKRTRLRIGNRYRVYFRRDDSNNELFPAFMAGDMLLGLEDLGEFRADTLAQVDGAPCEAEESSQTA